MNTLQQILALLTGRKVFDGHKWRVYDENGTELADPGGVLWKGVHGALLWNPCCCGKDEPPPPPAFYPNPTPWRRIREEDEILLALVQHFVLEVA